jgi:hypothetical protein
MVASLLCRAVEPLAEARTYTIQPMSRPKSIEVSMSLPFGLGGVKGTWQPDEREAEAAWEMYVELVTRVATVELGPQEGLLREALASLYSLFPTTRDILRRHGPSVARAKGEGTQSFGHVAVLILNEVLRPVLAQWHPALLDYEIRRPPEVSAAEHERGWERRDELRSVLGEVRGALSQYAVLLAEVAEVPLLTPPPKR